MWYGGVLILNIINPLQKIINNQMKNDPRSYDRNFYNCVKKPEKNSGLHRGLNPWPRDTGATLYQLSYEATDIRIRKCFSNYSSLGRSESVRVWVILVVTISFLMKNM